MSNSLLVSESTLTDRYQTTIPGSVRKALGLHKREKIRYTIQTDGNVLISRANQNEEDPALSGFLNFIANDIQKNPHHVQAMNSELVARVQNLIDDVKVDLESSLSDEDD